MKKKGMYFTLMTIAFVFIFIFVFMVPSYKRLSEKMSVVELRVTSMNDFIKDLQRDTERGLYISSYRALMSLEQHIIITGDFLNNTKESFEEAILDGVVGGANATLMIDSTFPDWIQNIQSEANKLNINADITIDDVDVFQVDPWNVYISANLSVSVSDATDVASWTRDEYVETSISIMEFEDPLYVVQSLGRTTNIINITPYELNYTFKVGEDWDIDNLLTHVNHSYYTFNADAPNFLMRFENNMSSSSCCGIESLVDLKRLESVGFQPHELNTLSSIVDYYYWSGDNNGDYRINWTPSWFKLDAAHLSKYNVTGLNYPS